MTLPDFKKEKSFARKGYKIIVGIDEAGRGPLAGPITAAALAVIGPISNFSARLRLRANSQAGGQFIISKQYRNLRFLKDSKKLTPKKREEFYGILTRHPRIRWAAASVGPGTIDRINVARAANLAARRAFQKLVAKICPCGTSPEGRQSAKVLQRPSENFSNRNSRSFAKIFVILDGSLSFKSEFPQETIVKGDEKIWSIAAASVIAKVTRDRKMRRLVQKFPGYGLEIHKGYGTKLHYQKLKKYGPSEIHRRTFL
jgi:ribonuclease HII